MPFTPYGPPFLAPAPGGAAQTRPENLPQATWKRRGGQQVGNW
jgi:hypothetical protein